MSSNDYKISYPIIGYGGFARELAKEMVTFFKENVSDKFSGDIDFYVEKDYYLDEYKNIPNIKILSETITKKGYVAIGDCKTRERLFNTYFKLDDCQDNSFYWSILKKNYHETNVIGNSSMLMRGSVITTNVKLGLSNLVNINATIGHDSIFGDFCTLSPGCNIAGNVRIGNRVYFGMGSNVIEGLHICNDVIIGAGAVVVKDITEPGTYVGIPAKKIK
jgi:sugar O-acyltransferase (sialic acid O-acetyltransferase NeuD family)